MAAKKNQKKKVVKKKTAVKKKLAIQSRPGQQSKFVLRIDERLHSGFKAKAADNHQSMNEYLCQLVRDDLQSNYSLKTLFQRLEKKKVI